MDWCVKNRIEEYSIFVLQAFHMSYSPWTETNTVNVTDVNGDKNISSSVSDLVISMINQPDFVSVNIY